MFYSVVLTIKRERWNQLFAYVDGYAYVVRRSRDLRQGVSDDLSVRRYLRDRFPVSDIEILKTWRLALKLKYFPLKLIRLAKLVRVTNFILAEQGRATTAPWNIESE